MRKIAIIVWALWGCGCASGIPNYNVTAYDGDYFTSFVSTESKQQIAGITLDCAPMIEPVFVRVQDGVASGYLYRDENYSFRTQVGRAGRLRAVMPIDAYYRYDSYKPVEAANLLLIFNAQLSGPGYTGNIDVGDRRFGFKGCSTTVEILAL